MPHMGNSDPCSMIAALECRGNAMPGGTAQNVSKTCFDTWRLSAEQGQSADNKLVSKCLTERPWPASWKGEMSDVEVHASDTDALDSACLP